MAYNYNGQMGGFQNQNIPAPIQNQNIPQQNIQPLFPQPQGNVYNINSTLEVANVPVGAGLSVALCLPENVMYIKVMQNGNPLFYPYKITPFTNENENKQTVPPSDSNDTDIIKGLAAQLKKCMEKINELESSIKENKKGSDFEL